MVEEGTRKMVEAVVGATVWLLKAVMVEGTHR